MEFSSVSSAESLLGRSLLFMLPSARGEFNDISVGWGTVNDGHSWHGLV